MRMTGALGCAVALLALSSIAQGAWAGKNEGMPAIDLDPTTRGMVTGTGLESRDVDALADQVMRDLLSRPDIAGQAVPPRIVIDGDHVSNNSSQRLDKDMLTDALRASLNRAAAGRIRFVSREAMAVVEQERALKREGVTDSGTRGLTRATAGADYQMIGKITSLDARDNNTGTEQRRMQVVLELVDLETGELPWTSEPYVILRATRDDVVYR